jgi:soluble lytic murein transglycosylase-like protein
MPGLLRRRPHPRLRLGCLGLCVALAVSLGALLVAALLAVPPRPAVPAPGTPAAKWSAEVAAAAAATGLSPALIRAVMEAESNGDSLAVSSRGAQGLMQLEPSTARLVGVADPWNPAQNLLGGARYLRSLLDRYQSRFDACVRGLSPGPCLDPLILALAAYNAGPDAVDRYGGIPPYPETRGYVRKVLALYLQILRGESSQAQRR